MSIRSKWKKYLKTIDENISDDIGSQLNKAVSKKQIEQIEGDLGFVLPDEVKEIYSINNGEKETMNGAFVGLKFITIEEMVSEWKSWKSISKNKEQVSSIDMCCKSLPEGAIKLQYTNDKWFPLTHDGSGNHLGLDFDPDINGKIGQVIIFGRDFTDKVVLADSLEELLDLMVNIAEDRLIGWYNLGNNSSKIEWDNEVNPIKNIYQFRNEGFVDDEYDL